MGGPNIQELLSAEGRYDAESLPLLEEHLEAQMKNKVAYDIEANLAILKLYLINPTEHKDTVVESILLKALTAFPATDFSLCMYQIPEKYHANLKPIIDLAKQLEMAKFKAFWRDAAVEENAQLLVRVTGWESLIQTFVAGVIQSTYRTISKEILAELMNVEVGKLGPIIKERGWSVPKDTPNLVQVGNQSFESRAIEPKGPSKMTLDQYRSLFSAAKN